LGAAPLGVKALFVVLTFAGMASLWGTPCGGQRPAAAQGYPLSFASGGRFDQAVEATVIGKMLMGTESA
jgi:hypothetical protein